MPSAEAWKNPEEASREDLLVMLAVERARSKKLEKRVAKANGRLDKIEQRFNGWRWKLYHLRYWLMIKNMRAVERAILDLDLKEMTADE